jgi:hypothetical protein
MQREAEYLALQAARAKARLKHTASTLADEVLAPFQVLPFIRRHPWWSVSGAAVLGFLSARPFRGRDRAFGSQGAGSRVQAHLAIVSRRIRRLLRRALSTIVVANLRSGAPGAAVRTARQRTATPPETPAAATVD